MIDRDTPLKLVRMWPEMAPGCYEQLDSLQRVKIEGGRTWPDYCVLPINAAYTYIQEITKSPQYAAEFAAELTACWLWRRNKIVYWFDRDLTKTLCEQAHTTAISSELPADLLLHPPYPAVYVKAPTIREGVDGFFYWLDYDLNNGRTELRIQWVMPDMTKSVPETLHLIAGASIDECLEDTMQTSIKNALNAGETPPEGFDMETAKKHMQDVYLEGILRALQHVLYIVSQNADVSKIPQKKKKKSKKNPGKSPKSQDVAEDVKGYKVGVRIGAAIRKAQAYTSDESAEPGSSKRPHSRRGHWHHYWTGPRDGERTLILKWVSPTYIHLDELKYGEPVVVYPVKE